MDEPPIGGGFYFPQRRAKGVSAPLAPAVWNEKPTLHQAWVSPYPSLCFIGSTVRNWSYARLQLLAGNLAYSFLWPDRPTCTPYTLSPPKAYFTASPRRPPIHTQSRARSA